MRPDLLLILPPYSIPFHQPIGLATLASHYRNQGRRVEVLDAIAEGIDHKQVIKCIMKRDPAIIGISIPYTEMAESGKKLLELCATVFHDREIWVGGHHTEVCPEEFTGDGYTAIGRIDISPNTIPAWDLMPVDKYDLTMYLSTKERAFPIQSSFGCPYRCAMCPYSKTPQPIRYKGIDYVLDEIKQVIGKYSIHGFHFWDETFTTNRSRTMELCERIIKENLGIHWSAQTRVGMIDIEMMKTMRSAGCVRVSFGIESGDQWVLGCINKNIDLAEAIDDVRIAKQAGMKVYAGYLIGNADDNIESTIGTIEFAKEANTDHAGFKIAIPYPGTVFRDQAMKNGELLTSDWSKYGRGEIVYVPEGLKGYDLKLIQQLANNYFAGKVSDVRTAIRQCKVV